MIAVFVPGATVRVVARGPLGGEPIAVQLGSTRFALRRSEAELPGNGAAGQRQQNVAGVFGYAFALLHVRHRQRADINGHGVPR